MIEFTFNFLLNVLAAGRLKALIVHQTESHEKHGQRQQPQQNNDKRGDPNEKKNNNKIK